MRRHNAMALGRPATTTLDYMDYMGTHMDTHDGNLGEEIEIIEIPDPVEIPEFVPDFTPSKEEPINEPAPASP